MDNRPRFVVVTVMFLLVACGTPEVQQENVQSDNSSEPESSLNKLTASQTTAKIDKLMAQYQASPGGAVMVIQAGKIVHQNGYGLANVEQAIPITPETRFHLGSVGKQFTAMGVLILAERGQVDIDAPIRTYIPELDWLDGEVTVRRLLNHTSGVMGYDESDHIYDALLASSPALDNEAVLQALGQFQAVRFNPGEKFDYSNTGYDILGILIERTSAQPYAHFMETHLFAPLGMTHTFALPSDRRFGPNVAQSYDPTGFYEPHALDNVNGSGSIYSTLADLYRYDQALSTEALVSPDLLEEMFTSGTLTNGQKTDYGLGWDVDTYAGYDYVGHQGSWLGFDAYYLRFPQEHLSVVVLLNLDYADPDSEEIAFAVAELYLP